jgi:O-antigen/teichoic acid export membrane protein
MYRELLKRTGTYSLAGLTTRAASFLMLPVYTRFLSPADYGVMELLDLTTTIVGLLLGARVGSAVFYYYFAASSPREKDECIGNVFFFAIGLGIAIAAITLPAAGLLSSLVFGTPQYVSYFRLLFLALACSLPVEAGFSCVRAFNEPALFVRLTVAQIIFSIVLNVLFLAVFHMGVSGMLTTGLITTAVLAVFMSWLILSPRKLTIKPRTIFQMFGYCLPLGLSGLAVFVIHYGDRVLLRRTVSLSDLGVYALSYKLGMLIAFVHAPYNLHWTSQVCDIVKAPGGDRIFVRSTTVLVSVLIFATLLLALFSELLVKVMAGPAFSAASALVPWLGAAYLIRAIGAHLQSVFTLEGRPALELKVNAIGSLACLVGYATLIPRYKLWGAVGATLLGFGVILVYSFWEAQRLRPFPFEYQKLLRICFFAMLSAAGFFALRPVNLWLQAGIALMCAMMFPAAVFLFCLNVDERSYVVAGAIRLYRGGSPEIEEAQEVSV